MDDLTLIVTGEEGATFSQLQVFEMLLHIVETDQHFFVCSQEAKKPKTKRG